MTKYTMWHVHMHVRISFLLYLEPVVLRIAPLGWGMGICSQWTLAAALSRTGAH